MPTESELLEAVLRAPDDDAPRIAYAEHCDALGDARGELVRLQLALARMERTDSLAAVVLRGRIDALLDEHDAVWAAPIAAIVDDHAYDRGFVEWVRMPAPRFLDRAPDLFALAPVRHLDLTGAAAVLDALLASPHLRGVRSLLIDREGLGDDAAAAIAASTNLGELRWLSLGENRIGIDGASALAASPNLPALAYVRFFGNRVDPHDQYAFDTGLVVDAWLPDDGVALEARHGRIPWLHGSPIKSDDVVPDRFRIEAATRA